MVDMDTIGDFLTRLRNAYQAHHPTIQVQASFVRTEIARILKEQGYIEDYQVVEDGQKRFLRVLLRYGPRQSPALREVTRVSKPGRRLYASAAKLPEVANGLGIAIISTSKGIMTDKEARRQNVGGEILCFVR
ncbi:MAG: 30S ribosomal protein S8 [Bacteroidia bacterium]|nr:30S ribosomal protein S8 [Bacteroidia bacterium]MCX7652701.1 30S ribosomal protein S8 [Bacteroidia bacterium]MDW8416415.1 30S ribosomal protein S8 [Bacteroidia bacterium]